MRNISIDKFKIDWMQYLTTLKLNYPEVVIEDDGDTVRIGELSKGCKLCKDGKWDCLFITPKCNLNCKFCISPFLSKSSIPVSSYGTSADVISDNYRKIDIQGCSYSGGEALLSFNELINIHKKLKENFPDNYFWIYTNGVLLKKESVKILSEIGIDEIRFNTAATGYNNPDILKIMEYSANIIDNVTIENPIINADVYKFMNSLNKYIDVGVKYLNLHDLMKENQTNSQQFIGEDFRRITFKDNHMTDISLDSRNALLKIIDLIFRESFPINLNYCSIVNKVRQIKKRRNNFANLLKKEYHKIADEEILETVKVFENNNNFEFLHPDKWEQKKNANGKLKFEKIRTFAPLSIFQKD